MFINKPKQFNFKTTVYSHGWYQLAPFELDEEKWHLKYVFKGETGEKPFAVTISETEKKIKIESFGKNIEKITENVRHILRIDENFGEFYQITENETDFAWIKKVGAGRLLRSPTVFEDLVKTVCTTNCSWALTKNMVENLVKKLGEKTKTDESSFPTAEAMASVDAEFYRQEIRAGYRSEYFAELAETVASGKINPENWLNSDLPTDELKKEIKNIKGVGNYAAENLLKLLGRYDGLALDSFLRSEFYKKHNNGNSCSDKEIENFYRCFGKWRGLVMWFDMSKRWLD